ncbi:unnamed protein product [Ectocarpus sp. 6 AP-2014]
MGGAKGGISIAIMLLGALITLCASHPLCYVDDRPTDPDEILEFCPEAQSGACCTDAEEALVQLRHEAVGNLTGDCDDLYKQVVCGVCGSYSGHLYERLGAELGVLDGMTMKSDFCEELVSACNEQITFPTYDGGDDYCTKHTGGGDDQFWSYPYTESDIFASGLTQVFDSQDDFPSSTIGLYQTPDSSMYWLVGQAGEIKMVDLDDLSTMTTVVDISSGLSSGELYVDYEEGLLGLAFSPLFSTDGYPAYFYLSYTVELDDGENQRNRLSKFQYFAGDPAFTLASEEVLLTSAPKIGSIHSAGWVGFQPSAYGTIASYHDIYWTTGDGASQTDPENHGQDTTNLLGSVMRISVPADGTGYEIPTGNLASPALPEICASGFRNPWRCSFDRETDELYCGDVGHTLVEEIDIVECGNNYGWSRFEGSRCQEAQESRDGPCLDTDRSAFTFPIYEYCHPDYSSDDADEADFVAGVDICGTRMVSGTAVIGGYVYRGTYFADVLYGAYVFGDNTSNNIYYIVQDSGVWSVGTIISDSSVSVIGFAEDNNGELMVIDQDYNIYQLPCGDMCASTCLDQSDQQPTYESLGCFVDVLGDRALENDDAIRACLVDERVMSPAICASYCYTLGATYAGVQFGFECFCGVDSDYSRHGTSTTCNMECTGYPSESCGGFLSIEVYELGEPEASDSSALLLAGGPTPVGPTAYVEDTADSSSASRTASPGAGGPLKMILLSFVGLVFMFVAL